MSRKKEPAVISLAFLTSVAETAAEEKAKKEPASVPRPPVDLTQVKELSLSFRGMFLFFLCLPRLFSLIPPSSR